MPRATWNGETIAESSETRVVEGNHYFPPRSVRKEFLTKTRMHTVCPWKGVASYYTINVDGVEYPNGAWYYPRPFRLARKIKDHVAFYDGVEIVEE